MLTDVITHVVGAPVGLGVECSGGGAWQGARAAAHAGEGCVLTDVHTHVQGAPVGWVRGAVVVVLGKVPELQPTQVRTVY